METLFGSVIIPPAVAEELAHPPARFRVIRPEDYPFIRVQTPRDLQLVNAISRSLDLGEAEAIALAIELRAELLLIDETAGRMTASQRGIPTTGVLGVLIRAKSRGLISTVGPLAIRLRNELGFHLSDAVIAEARLLAGEP